MLKTNLNEINKCIRCNKEIFKDSKFVLLGTYEKETIEETFFHADCYTDWINLRIKEHSINQWNQAMKDMMPHVAKMVKEGIVLNG